MISWWRKSKTKIKVLKKTSTNEISGDNPPLEQVVEACGLFKVEQDFIVGADGGMPEVFCHRA